MTWWKPRWRASQIGLRLLAFNILVVFVPIVGVLYLDVYENRLLDAQERAMVQQGRILAAAVGGTGEIDAAGALELLRRLSRRNDARLRVFDRGGALIADSAAIAGLANETARQPYGISQRNTRETVLYRLGAALVWVRGVVSSLVTGDRRSSDVGTTDEANGVVDSVVATALRGRYGAATRPTPGERSVTLYSAVPVLHGNDVVGSVVVSQSSFRILQALYDVRLDIFQIVIASLVVAAVLTMVASTTIVRPLTRLRRAATSLTERRMSLLTALPGIHRRDEIGELARDLQDLTGRLHAHIGMVEGFAADVAHEFKNPLAGIRSAAETIEACEDPAERSRFVALMVRDVGRLERLVSGLRDLARVDRRVEDRQDGVANVTEVVRTVSESLHAVGSSKTRVDVHGDTSCCVAVDSESLAQVVENLLSNAVTFAPEGSTVEVNVRRDGDTCTLSVADRGPGLPEAHLARVFDRFFTYRPSDERREHLGLGLAIVKRIVEGHGGGIVVANREGGGARFEARLPATGARS